MNRCATCKHWLTLKNNDRRTKPRKDGAGFCSRIPSVDGNYASDAEGLPRIEGWDDGGPSGCFESADFITPPDFGCALHEEKP